MRSLISSCVESIGGRGGGGGGGICDLRRRSGTRLHLFLPHIVEVLDLVLACMTT